MHNVIMRVSKKQYRQTKEGFYGEENEFTKDDFSGFIFGNWIDSSIYHDADSTDWKYALSNAYTCAFVWIYLWRAVGINHWIYHTVTQKCNIWNADDDAKCSLHGI